MSTPTAVESPAPGVALYGAGRREHYRATVRVPGQVRPKRCKHRHTTEASAWACARSMAEEAGR